MYTLPRTTQATCRELGLQSQGTQQMYADWALHSYSPFLHTAPKAI
jgi:hypothetical protein